MAVFISDTNYSRPESRLETVLLDFLAQDAFLLLRRIRPWFPRLDRQPARTAASSACNELKRARAN